MDGEFARHLRRLAVLSLIACAAVACGRKGALEPPPNTEAAKAQNASDQAESSAGGLSALRAKKPKPVEPPKTSFILDPLL